MIRDVSNNKGFGVNQRFKTLAGSTVLCAISILTLSEAQARVRHAPYDPRSAIENDEPEAAAVTGRSLQSGGASWYGPGFHGRRTASGEVFNQNAMTAAHKSLPFGTRVRVVNQHTGRSVVVRINDRGPFVRGRIIDLSKASAQALGVSGNAPVKLVSLN